MAIFPFLLAASMAGASLPQPAPPQSRVEVRQARPALWVVNDGDTIIYLFGTFHALDGDPNWFEQSVRTAFSASDELILETLVPRPLGANRATAGPRVAPVQPGQPQSVSQLAPSSFLATTKMVMNAGKAKGLSTDHGADAVLRDAADEAGKPVTGLESFDFQLTMFSSLPPPPKAAMAGNDPKTAQALGAVLAQLQAAWRRGQIETFAPMLRQMQAQSPKTYNVMFVERNERWAQWIADRLEQPGTIFVAVGAGHLSGPDSVQNKLAMLGVKSARVN